MSARKQDSPNGHGSFKFLSGADYEGDFENGAFHGWGVYTYADQSVFTGQFVRGQREGRGYMEMPTGDKYEGKNEGTSSMGIPSAAFDTQARRQARAHAREGTCVDSKAREVHDKTRADGCWMAWVCGGRAERCVGLSVSAEALVKANSRVSLPPSLISPVPLITHHLNPRP